MNEKHHETTAEHFSIFKEQVEKELERFGLKGYDVVIVHESCGEALANITWSQMNRWARIRLNTAWGEEVTENLLRKAAFHEVMELLLSPMNWLACNASSFSGDQREAIAEKENHTVIRTLENVIGYLS